MDTKIYIALFKDGTMMPSKVKPDAGDYQAGTRIFEASEDTTLATLSFWYGKSNQDVGNITEVK